MTNHSKVVKRLHEAGVVKGPQLVLMLLLNRRNEGWQLGDLADVAGLTPPMINAIKCDLIKKGWTFVHYPERDLRVAKLYLTPAGRAKAAEMWAATIAFAGIAKSWKTTGPPVRKQEKRPTQG